MRGEYGVYQVTGRRRYRGHEPGTIFEACIPATVERRAVQRGDIRLLRRELPTLQPGSYRLPKDWPPTAGIEATEAPRGASLISEGGK